MPTSEINGSVHQLDPAPDDTAVDLLRERLRLTGTKVVCGAGVCGACTILLDGRPVAGCLLPAGALAGRAVTTVEGIDDRHPVVRAFIAHAAMQCGFCTPGFVVEAVSFHDRWRADHGAVEPPREVVAAALSGHLCRCGAYVEILDAVGAACAGRHDEGGVPGARVEAADKVTGRARYTVDVHLDGQLEGALVRSTHPHARIVDVDTSAARAIAGVHAVVGMLGETVVRYVGQEIAVVVADDRRTAERAVAAVRVSYAPLPAVVDASAARAEGAPVVYPRGRRRPPNAAEGPLFPAPWHGNVRGPLGSFSTAPRRARRTVAAARRDGDDRLVEGTFRTGAQLHTAFEPHAAVAVWNGNALLVHVSTQAVGHVAAQLATRFGLDRNRVRVVAEHVGGGFGAKLALTPETVAAVLGARATSRPVRVVLDRAEELSVTGFRPPAEMTTALLAGPDGELSALRLAAYTDSGVAVGTSVASLARLIYPAEAKELLDYDVVTNVAPGSPFRGPSGPLTCFALESVVDEAARRIGTDPLRLRRRWDPDPLRQRLYRWAADLPVWRQRADLPRTGRFRRGIGVGAATWLYFWEPGVAVEVRVEDGMLVVSCAVQDIGTGSRTVLAGAVADVFGLPTSRVRVRIGDSTLPHGPISGGSRTTASIVPAARNAAEQLRDDLVRRSGLAGARATAHGITHRGGVLPWQTVFAGAGGASATSQRQPDDRRLARATRPGFGAAGLTGAGYSFLLRRMSHLNTGRGATGAVHLAEVEVDTLLGRTRVLRVHAGLAVGRPAVPPLAAAQAHGAIIQNIGYALYEERRLDTHSGHTLSAGLEDYRIPGIGDVPEIVLHFDPDGFAHVVGGGVGMGEVAGLPVAAAIANAVRDATGYRPDELPITPQRLLAGLSSGGPR